MNPAFSRILPFAIYMIFVAALEVPSLLGFELPPDLQNPGWTYSLKIGLTGLAIIWCWKRLPELRWNELGNTRNTATSILIGVIVFVLWINMDQPFLVQGELTTGFDPNQFAGGTQRLLMITIRIFGAAVVVPIAEELFWRSFLIRYLVKQDFLSVPRGLFTPFSFVATVILFGLEHQMIGAGMMAGVAYNILYYRTKSVTQCVLAHAVTNFSLGIYVVLSGATRFW